MTAKHAPDRVEQMSVTNVECDCSCGWASAAETWSEAFVTLGNHVNSENQALLESVANTLFHVAHPSKGHYRNHPDETIEQYDKLAQHVLDHGYVE